MNLKLNIDRDDSYLSSKEELFLFIDSRDSTKNVLVKNLKRRIEVYRDECKFGLLPNEELKTQLGRILNGIKYFQTLDKKELQKERNQDKGQFIRGKGKLASPFDPFLIVEKNNDHKIFSQSHLKREKARLNLLMLTIESLDVYRQGCEDHINKLNISNLSGARVDYINYYNSFLSETLELIANLKFRIIELQKEIQSIDANKQFQDDNMPIFSDLEILYELISKFNWKGVVEWLHEMHDEKKVELSQDVWNKMVFFEARINLLINNYNLYWISTFETELSLIKIFNEILDNIEEPFNHSNKESAIMRILKWLKFA